MVEPEPAPNECREVAEPKRDTEHEPRDDGKTRATQHVALKFLLHGVEAVGHPLLAPEGTQNGIVFDAFLDVHLDLAFLLADVEGHALELVCDELPEDDGERCKDDEGPGEPGVEEPHKQKRTQQLYAGHDHLGDGVGDYARDGIDVLREARGHVAGVQLVLVEEPARK